MATNKFSELKEKMEQNLKDREAPDETDEQNSLDDFSKDLTETAGGGGGGAAAAVTNTDRNPASPVSTPANLVVPLTRKTSAIPLTLDIAIKELKNRRNLARQISKKGRDKTTEDDIIIEALEFYSRDRVNSASV